MPEKAPSVGSFSKFNGPIFFRDEEKLAASLAHMVPHPLPPSQYLLSHGSSLPLPCCHLKALHSGSDALAGAFPLK